MGEQVEVSSAAMPANDMNSGLYLDVLPLAELPEGSQRILIQNDGEAIALFHAEGKIYALGNRCVHRGGSIGDGNVSRGTVICPMHEWIFRLEDGLCVDNLEMGLKTYETKVNDNMIQVYIEDAK